MGAITGLICGLIMLVRVEALGQEDDGEYNHLLVPHRTPAKTCTNSDTLVRGVVKISHSAKEKLANEGEYIKIRVDAECFAGFGIDESFRNFWAKYRVWLCDSTQLEKL
jgi:hypothetical protein